MAPLLPIFLNLSGRSVLIVGGGPVAASKLGTLVPTGADITVVAPAIVDPIREAGVTLLERPFIDSDLDGRWLVLAAATPEVNAAVARAAETRRVFVNAVDDPANATAYLGGIVRRRGVTVAISTAGRAPALAGLLREGLDAMLPGDDELDVWLGTADELRRRWRSTDVPMTERRPELADALLGRYCGTLTSCRAARDLE